MKPSTDERARRRGRARRPITDTLARSTALFMVLQGLALLVILAGLILITVGMTASLGDFFTDLSGRARAIREAEADIPVPLAMTGRGTLPEEAGEARPTPADPRGFLPFQVAADQLDQHAPELPTLAPTPEPVFITATPQPTTQPTPYILEVTQTPEPSPTPLPPGPPERIVIPIIALDAPVTPAYTQFVELRGQIFEQWTAPDWYAAGWQQGSAQVGAVGNTVLNGHHNIHGSVFSLLHQLVQGDQILIYTGDRELRYVVSQVMNLQETGIPLEQRLDNARWVLPSTDERLTLVTCWPPESNTHRIIVVAVPVR